jgi:hypothetical protein
VDACKLISLERPVPTTHHQARGFIILNTKTSYEVPGAKSPTRFSAGQRLDFVVRSAMAASMTDPTIIYSLHILNSQKNLRELVRNQGRVSPLGWSAKMKTGDTVPLEFSKYGNSSFRIITPQLAPGEYSIGRASGLVMFCFGVD